MTERRWKAVLALIALLAVLVTGYEAWHGVPRVLSSTTGRLGIEGDELGPGRIQVTGMQPWSPFLAAGVAIGDVVVADHWYDLARHLLPGEAINLTIDRDGRLHRVTVRAVPGPQPSFPLRLFYLVHVVRWHLPSSPLP